MSQRIIAHFDLDSFFVSVEILHNPALKGLPVIVGGKERGVVAACSYEARKFGIHSAMPSKKAEQLCPHAIFVSGSYANYSEYSRKVTKLIADAAPLFEKASIDEFYLDLTGMGKFFDPLTWTIELRNKIMKETGLPISFGLSSSKMVAKMATNLAKPNGYLQIPFGKEKEFLAPLFVGEIPGVGKHTQELLAQLNIKTIKELSECDAALLQEYLGNQAVSLQRKSLGIHTRIVSAYHESKSISSENTFNDDSRDLVFLNSELVRLTEKVCYQLRKEEKLAGCVSVKIRYSDFETFSKQTTISFTSADDEMIPVIKDLFKKLYTAGMFVRLIGVKVSELTNVSVQTNLFADTEKKAVLYKTLDGVKDRFGKVIIKRASSN